MKVYVFRSGRSLFGIFKDMETAREECVIGECCEVEIFTSTGLCADGEESYSLFSLTVGGAEYWIRASDYYAALVDAVLYRRSQGLPDGEVGKALVYDFPVSNYGTAVLIPGRDIDELSPLAPPLLAALTPENRDLVAHALEGIELLDTEEELWKREVYRNTSADAILGLVDEKPYEGVDAMTDQELSGVADYVFGSITILDSVALRPSVAAYLHECFDLSDRREILFRHAIFERWGGFDTRFPHFLYRAVIDGYFAPLLPEFAKRRRALTL